MTPSANARVAGTTFLLYIAIGITEMVVSAPAGHGSSTAERLASVAANATIVRGGTVFALAEMLCAFTLAVTLYALTRDIDRELALLAMTCRVAEGIIGVAGTIVKPILLSAATIAGTATGVDAAASRALGAALLKADGGTVLLSATPFAIGSTVFAYLFLRGRTIPTWLAWLGVVASALLVVVLPLQILGQLRGPRVMAVWIPMAVFEVTLAIVFLVRGAREPAA